MPPRSGLYRAGDQLAHAGLSAPAARSRVGNAGLGRLRGHTATAPQAILEPLTVRETEVPAHLADFLNTEQIAQTMFVSLDTVRTHIRSILRKLGVVSRQNEAFRAWDLALLPLRSPALALGEGL